MKTLAGTICISRPSRGDNKDVIELILKDDASRVQFLKVRMDPADFAMALTGLAFRPVELEVQCLDKVGLFKEMEPGVAIVNEGQEGITGGKDGLRRYIEEKCQRDGWHIDAYLGGQDSVIRLPDGTTRLRFTYYRYVKREA